jgi:hypothetical protein
MITDPNVSNVELVEDGADERRVAVDLGGQCARQAQVRVTTGGA